MNPADLAGCEVPATTHVVTGDDVAAYQRATGGAPPAMILARYLVPAVIGHLTGPAVGLHLERMVHAEQEFSFLGPIAAGDVIEVSGRVQSVAVRGDWARLVVETWARVGGFVVGTGRSLIMVQA